MWLQKKKSQLTLIWCVGVLSCPCAMHDPGFDASSWAWLSGAVLCSRALLMWHEWGWACPHSACPLAEVGPKWNGRHSLAGGEAVSMWKVVDCVGGFAPPMQEVGYVVVMGVWWNVIDVTGCAVLLALFVDFWWASGGWSKFLGE